MFILIDIINQLIVLQPVVSTGSPALFAGIIKHPTHCDLTCFNKVVMYGFATNETTLNLVKVSCNAVISKSLLGYKKE